MAEIARIFIKELKSVAISARLIESDADRFGCADPGVDQESGASIDNDLTMGNDIVVTEKGLIGEPPGYPE